MKGRKLTRRDLLPALVALVVFLAAGLMAPTDLIGIRRQILQGLVGSYVPPEITSPPPTMSAAEGHATLGGRTATGERGAGGFATGEAALDSEYSRAALWFGTNVIDLGTLGGASSIGLDVNSSGEVVGMAQTASGDNHAFYWKDINGNSLSDPGEMLDLGTLGGSFSRATGINEEGYIIGTSATTGDAEVHGFFYDLISGQMSDLGTLGGPDSTPYDINEANVVVGNSETNLGEVHAFRWAPGQGMSDLGTLGGNYSTAFGINDHGDIVGKAENLAGVNRAFKRQVTTGVMEDLGTLGGVSSSATAINNNDLVVGVSENAEGVSRAFTWRGGTMADLGTLGGDESSAFSVDQNDRVVGYSYGLDNANSRMVEWHRVP